jgi:hypothetical protein
MFTYWGRALEYYDAAYNDTRKNERAVELPIASDWLNGRDKFAGLEVGNVTAHYGAWHASRIVDRYEPGDGVDNCDVFDIAGPFDWILSISTLEHVRWDEPDTDPFGSVNAICHLRKQLAPHGEMLVTVPMGHHPYLDGVLAHDRAGAHRACTLIRVGDGWRQTDTPMWKPYGATTIWAESVWVGEFVA